MGQGLVNLRRAMCNLAKKCGLNPSATLESLAMFRLERVSKRFGNVIALESVDLTIQPQRTTVLIGPSGSGKSTVLRLMTGLAQPDAGAVYFQDARVTPDNIMRLRQRMGYVIQEG